MFAPFEISTSPLKKENWSDFLGPNGARKNDDSENKVFRGSFIPTPPVKPQVLGHVPWKRAREYQMQLTMVMGQRTQLWWDLPAWDSFLLNKEIYEIPKAQFDETVEELSRLLEIQDLLSVPVKKLSLGQRMKAELACSLLHRPKVLLFLDEPTIGLDVLMQQVVRQFILEYNKRYKATILLTSHNMEDISELCTRLILINHGHILSSMDLSPISKLITTTNLSLKPCVRLLLMPQRHEKILVYLCDLLAGRFVAPSLSLSWNAFAHWWY